jgi:hypothetical protein
MIPDPFAERPPEVEAAELDRTADGVHRQISLQLILGQGQFGESGTDTVKLSGPLRALQVEVMS